jgi:hypothetical protein
MGTKIDFLEKYNNLFTDGRGGGTSWLSPGKRGTLSLIESKCNQKAANHPKKGKSKERKIYDDDDDIKIVLSSRHIFRVLDNAIFINSSG